MFLLPLLVRLFRRNARTTAGTVLAFYPTEARPVQQTKCSSDPVPNDWVTTVRSFTKEKA